MYDSVVGSKRRFTELEDDLPKEEQSFNDEPKEEQSYSNDYFNGEPSCTKPRLGGDTPFVNGYMDRWVVRMRGLPYRATKEEVESFFADVDVAPVKICFAQLRSGRSSGEALIEFDSKENLDKAYEKNKEDFHGHGRYIELFDSTPDAIDLVSGAKANIPVEEICDTSTSVVKLRGLPFTAGTEEVQDFLRLKDLDPVRIHHVKDRIGRPAGMCYVELVSKEDADVALTLNKSYMGSRYVEVFPSTHDQLAKDVNRGVMTVEAQFAGGAPRGRGNYSGRGYRGFSRGGRGRGLGRGRGRGGLGYWGKGRGGRGGGFRGRGRGMSQGSWISTTVVQPPAAMSRGGYGSARGRGRRGSPTSHQVQQAPWNQQQAPAPWNPNQMQMPPNGQHQGFDGPQNQYGVGHQSGPGFQGESSGYQNGSGFHGGAGNGAGFRGGAGYQSGSGFRGGAGYQSGPAFRGGAGYQNGPGVHGGAGHQNGSGFRGGAGFQQEQGFQGGSGGYHGGQSTNAFSSGSSSFLPN